MSGQSVAKKIEIVFLLFFLLFLNLSEERIMQSGLEMVKGEGGEGRYKKACRVD